MPRRDGVGLAQFGSTQGNDHRLVARIHKVERMAGEQRAAITQAVAAIEGNVAGKTRARGIDPVKARRPDRVSHRGRPGARDPEGNNTVARGIGEVGLEIEIAAQVGLQVGVRGERETKEGKTECAKCAHDGLMGGFHGGCGGGLAHRGAKVEVFSGNKLTNKQQSLVGLFFEEEFRDAGPLRSRANIGKRKRQWL